MVDKCRSHLQWDKLPAVERWHAIWMTYDSLLYFCQPHAILLTHLTLPELKLDSMEIMMVLDYPDRPFDILLYDDGGCYRQPLAAALCTGQPLMAKLAHVDSEATFRRALAGNWDAIFIAYAVATTALTIVHQSASECSCILLYKVEEEEQAFAMVTEQICDLLPLDDLRRLPLILRREWQRKKFQANRPQRQQLKVVVPTELEGAGDTLPIADLLWESEQRLRLFVEHAPAAIAMFDRNMNYIYASHRWLLDYRLDEEQIIGRSHYEIFPDIPEAWREIHQRCLTGAVELSDADPFPRADGTLDWVRWEIHPWRNIHGEIGGIMIFSEVITEHKRATEVEREQRLFAEAMRDSLAVLTASLDVETVMQQILEFSARVVPSDAGGILLLEGTQGRVAYLRGHTPEAEAFFKETPITVDQQLYRKGPGNQTYYLAADTHLTEGWKKFPETAWVRSSIGVQIDLHGKSIGFLTADSATPNQYRQKDVENLQAFAHYAALALENAYHIDHLEQRVRERTAELEAAKSQVEAILNNSPDGILLIHEGLTIQQGNHTFYRLFDCQPKDCHAQSLLRLIHQDERANVEQLMNTVILDEVDSHVEFRAVRKDDIGFDAEMSVGLIKGNGLVCVIRDITARKEQERQLRYHASLQGNVSDAVIVTDAEFRIQSWNKAAERIYGWRAEQANGKGVLELLQTKFESPEAHAQSLVQLRERGWWQGEVIQQHQDGTPRYIWGSVSLLRDANGIVESVVAVNHDITERKAAEQKLQQSAAEIHDLYNNAPCGYHSLDQDGMFVQINETELQWLGYTRDEVVGKIKFADLLTAESLIHFQANFSVFKARGWVNDLEFDLICKDSTIVPVLLNSTAIYDEAGHYRQSRSTLFNVTELRQAQQVIIESEARYRLLAENIFDMVSRHSIHGDFLYVSPSTERLLGYKPEALIGTSGFQIIHPDQWTQMAEMMRQASLPGGRPTPQIFEAQHGAGHTILIEIGVRGIFSEATNELVEFISSTRDVTEQKRAEAALRASDEKFRQVAENFDHLLFIRSADNQKMLYVNSALERLAGIQRAEMFENPQMFLAYVHPDDLAYVRQEQWSLRNIEEGYSDLEYRFIRPDRQLLWIRVRTFPIKDENGGIISRVGTVEDITKRKLAELALQESETKYRLLVETMRGGLIIFDATDQISYVNDRFCEMVGRPREQLIGTMPTLYVDDATAAQMKTEFDHRHRLENTSYELVIPRPDGQLLYLLAQGSPLLDKEGNFTGSFSIVTDITAQKQAEDALRQALAQEKELSELKSRFVSIASHEFRTPLATISATTETLLVYRDRLDGDQVNMRLHKILAQVGHLKEMMDDVLQLARIQAHRVEFAREMGDLHLLCCDVMEEFRSHPAYNERIHHEPHGSPLHLSFDPRLMRHVISNLIANGLKYSPKEKPIVVKLYQDSEIVTLQVTDYGIGIPDADLKHIFEPFHRASNVGTISGTGLGLSITKEAIELHGGTIHIATKLDTGTTVTVILPKDVGGDKNETKNFDH